jgi:hypothetical protein
MTGEVPAEMILMLGRLDGKLDGILDQLRKSDRRAEIQEQRITKLEQWRTDVEATKRTAFSIGHAIWAVCGTAVLGIVGWIISSFVHSSGPMTVTHKEITRVESPIPPAGAPPK